MQNLLFENFSDIDLNDPFFDSLKADYVEFGQWFQRKADSDDCAYVFRDDEGRIDGFLYLKFEEAAVTDVVPTLAAARRIKVGTMKINAHGTKLGERFVKKIFDHAVAEDVDEVYVTIFAKHAGLIGLFSKYGFTTVAKKHSGNGTEEVLIKSMRSLGASALQSYPLISLENRRIFLLSLKPEWHSRLLPDSILKNEDSNIVQDVSFTNSIHKVYLAAMDGVQRLRPGDVLLIYRTSDNVAPARYRSVATSICVVEDNLNINDFSSENEFLSYCEPYSVFTRQELVSFWQKRRYPYIFRFTYNIALPKRVTRGVMIDECGLSENAYAGIMELSPVQFSEIIKRGRVDEGLIIH